MDKLTNKISDLSSVPVYANKFNELIDEITDVNPSAGTMKADVISEYTSAAGVTVDGVLIKDSGITAAQGLAAATGYNAPIIPIAAQNAITTSGTNQAIAITNYLTTMTSTGTGNKVSIVATGVVKGQLKKIKYAAEGAGGDTIVLTPSVTTGFATITFNAVNDYVIIMFNGTYWVCIETSGATVAAGV